MPYKTVTIPLELAQFALNAVEYLALRGDDIGISNVPVAEELRALLAAPAVERQAEPIYQVRYLGDGGGGWIDVERDEFNSDNLGISNYQTRTLYTSPPAPVVVVLPERMPMPNRSDYASDEDGTDSFYADSVEADTWNACLDKVKELNQ